MNSLSDYIQNELPIKVLETLKKEFQSHKRFFWVLRNPEQATGEELLTLHDHTGIDIPTLLNEYLVAINTLGPREKNFYTIQHYAAKRIGSPQNGAHPTTYRVEADASV